MTQKANNAELSFWEMPPEEQVKLLLAQNETLQKKLEATHKQFEAYEESDRKLLSKIAHLERELNVEKGKQSKPGNDNALHVAKNEIEGLRRLIDAMGGSPDVIANGRWHSRIVRAYFRHYGLNIEELNQFVRFMSRQQQPSPEDFFKINPVGQ